MAHEHTTGSMRRRTAGIVPRRGRNLMNITALFLEQLEREAAITRRVLERVPPGLTQWKPHPKSMPFGYLASLCATMIGWIELMVNQPSLDLNPPGGSGERPPIQETADQLVVALDAAVAKSR